MNKKLLELIREKFQAKLATKTGWGRNDVIAVYDQAVSEALVEIVDQQSIQTK